MFNEYQSKPITRKAHKITPGDYIKKVQGKESTWLLRGYEDDENYYFKAYEEIKVGDYIIYLDDKDIYHCTKKVFEERNIV